MAGRVLYFAYGSNLSTERLRSRIGEVIVVGPAVLQGFKLLFNKLGLDGSGKANLNRSTAGVTWGVLYEVGPPGLEALDRIEKGYDRLEVVASPRSGGALAAAAYISTTRLTDDPRPFSWYKELVVAGAREHGLPLEHVAYLEGILDRGR